MKNYISIIAVFFLTNMTIIANDNNHTINSSDPITTTTEAIINNAFYSNENNDMVFIDFEDIKLTINTINIIQHDVTIMEEDVKDLPQNLIHEIDLTFFEKGNYTLELVTQDNVKIRKDFIIE